MQGSDPYISLSEAAKASGYTAEYLRQLCVKGKLESKKIGKSWVTTAKALDKFNSVQQTLPLTLSDIVHASVFSYSEIQRILAITFAIIVFFPVVAQLTRLPDRVNYLTKQASSLVAMTQDSINHSLQKYFAHLLGLDQGVVSGTSIASVHYPLNFIGPQLPVAPAKSVAVKTSAPATISDSAIVNALRRVLAVGLPDDIKLALQGPPGVAGPAGAAGPQGPAGYSGISFTAPGASNPGSIGGITHGSADEFITRLLTVNSTSTLSTTNITGTLTVTGDLNLTGTSTFSGNIKPATDNTFDIGSTALRFKTLHAGPNGLVVHNDATNTNKVSLNFVSSTAVLGTDAATPLQITTGTNAGLNIATTGNVGIGTTNPLANVDVRQLADGNTTVYVQRFTDTTPTGNFLDFRTASGSSSLFSIDASANLITTGNISQTGATTISTGTGAVTLNGTVINLTGVSPIIDLTSASTLSINTTTNRPVTFGTGLVTTNGDLTSVGNTTLGTGANKTNTFGTGTAAANTFGASGGTNAINGSTTILGTTLINTTGTAATNIGNSTGALVIASGGTSSWTNTSGDLTIQTATTGTMSIDSIGILNLGTVNSTATNLGKSATTLTINPTAWTATPTISGLVTTTSGLTSNGAVTVQNNSNFSISSGTGTFTQTYTGTVDTSKALSVSNTGVVVGTGYAGYFSKTGASTTNVGLYATATGATNNYAAIFDAGNVGIGSATPGAKLDVVGSQILSGNLTLTGTSPILDLTSSSTLSINTTTNRPVTFGTGTVTIPNLSVTNSQNSAGTFVIDSNATTQTIFTVTGASLTSGVGIAENITANADNGQITKGHAIAITDATVGSGGYTAVSITATGAGTGLGNKYLLDMNPGTNKEVVFDANGAFRPTVGASSNTNTIGSSDYYWKTGFFDQVTANNLSGTVITGATSSTTWTIGSTQVADVNESLIFYRNNLGAGNASLQWNAGASDLRYLTVNYPFNATYTVDDTSIGTGVNLYSGSLVNNTTAGTQKLLSLTNAGTGTTETGIYINNTGTAATNAIEIAGTWTTGILTNNNSINAGSGAITGGNATFSGGTVDVSAAATNITIKDNTSSSFTIKQGTNSYFDITTTDNAEIVTLDLPTGGGTTLTGNIFTSNIAKIINIGTGTAADTIHIGEGGTSANTITIGSDAVANTITIGSASSTGVSITDNNWSVTTAGAATFVGVNSGAGLVQGTGGITFTGTANINATGTAATNIGNSTGALVIASGGTSGWTNTAGDLTIQTASSGTMNIDSIGILNLGTVNSTATNLGKAATTLTINPTAWTATPTISGLITATSGITSNGVATFNNNISQVGAYTFGTGSGAVSLNGATSVTGSNTFATGTGIVTLNNVTTNISSSSPVIDLTTATTLSINTTTNRPVTFGTGLVTTNGDLTSVGNTTLGTGANKTNTFGTGTGAANTFGVAGGTNAINGSTTILGTTLVNSTGTAATSIGNSTGALVIASGGTSSWTNTAGDLTIQTVTSGAMSVDSAGILNLGTVNSTATNLGKAATTLTINPTAWTATPTISGLITATSGLTSNGAVTVQNNSNFSISSGTGTFTQTYAPTTDATVDAHSIILSAGGTGATGTLRGLVVTQNDTATTGAFDSLAYIQNLKTPETTTNGLLIEQNATGGTMTNGLAITNTAGNLTTGISLTGTFTNSISAPSFTVSNAGLVTSVGVNSGAGLIQGTGGFTLTGTANINATGTAATSIGNSTGALVIASGGTSSWTNTAGDLTIQTVTSGAMSVDSAGILNLGTVNSTATNLGKAATTLTINPTSWTATPTISGLVTATSGITSNGVATFNNNISQVGAYTFGTGTGAISLNGATSVTGTNTFTVGTGLTSLGGNLTVTGTAWTATPTISGLITATSGITSNGTVTIQNNSNFTQVGSGTFGTGTGAVSLNGATSVTGTNTFNVGTGLTTLGGNLTVTGTAWTATPTISGLITATSGLTSNGTTAVTGTNTFTVGTGLTSLGGNLTVTGTAWTATPTISGLVTATSGITSNSTLTMGANSITMTGSLAATGARVLKGWFTDIESTNIPTVGGVSINTAGTLNNVAYLNAANAFTNAGYNTFVGNVGIGTTSPSAPLYVTQPANPTAPGVSATFVSDFSNPGLFSDGTYGNYYGQFELGNRNQTNGNVEYFSFSGNSTPGLSSAIIGAVNTDHANYYGSLFFGTRGSAGFGTRMLIDQNGNVGIGTSVVGSKLVIKGSDALSTSSALNIIDSNDVSRLFIQNAGNVGIGTTGPLAHLQIGGNLSASSWTTTGIAFDSTAATYTDTSTAAAGTVTVRTANSFGAPTFASTNAITVTDAYSLYVPKPIAGTNTTITRANSAYFGGAVSIQAVSSAAIPSATLDVVGAEGVDAIFGKVGVIRAFSTTVNTGSPKEILTLARIGVPGVSYTNVANFLLSRYSQAAGTQARTQLDIALSNDNVNDPDMTVMSLLGSGNVGIGTTDPDQLLDVRGNIAMGIRAQSATDRFIGITDTGGGVGAARAGINIKQSAGGNTGISFQTGNWGSPDTESMTILGSGNVGIGTSAPGQKLEVTGNIRSSWVASSEIGWNYLDAGNFKLGMQFDSGSRGLNIFDISPNSDSFIAFKTGTTPGTERMRILDGGNVGIGTTNPTTMLVVGTATTGTGDITVYGTGTTCTIGNGTGATNCTSDIRLKDNVATMGNELDNLMALRPVTFNWKDPNRNKITNTGLIAQEVRSIYPNMVHVVYDDYLGIDYAALVVPAIKGIQELNNNLSAVSARTSSVYSAGYLEAGDVVAFDILQANGIKKVTSASTQVLGVVQSFNAVSQTASVGYSGRMNVKVTAENGDVKKGDLLTISQTLPGYAMKMNASGQSIGIALADSTSGTDVISVFVNLAYQRVNIASNATGDRISYDKDIDMSDFSIINVKTIASMSGKWQIAEDGTITAIKIVADEIEAKKIKITGSSGTTIGRDKILAGNIQALILNDNVTPQSAIFVTLRGDYTGRYWIDTQVEGSFAVKVSQAPTTDLLFDYWIVDTDQSQLTNQESGITNQGASGGTVSGDSTSTPAPTDSSATQESGITNQESGTVTSSPTETPAPAETPAETPAPDPTPAPAPEPAPEVAPETPPVAP